MSASELLRRIDLQGPSNSQRRHRHLPLEGHSQRSKAQRCGLSHTRQLLNFFPEETEFFFEGELMPSYPQAWAMGQLAGPRPNASLCAEKGTDMQPYLHIGGNDDGLSHLAPNDAETVIWRVGITGKETYVRSTLCMGDVSVTVCRHESLTP